MSKYAVVYWSGSGNTESMAKAVAEGVKTKGADVEIINCDQFSTVGDYDGYAFGCPSMGAEVLEEGEFQPMWDAVKNDLKGKKVVLFGSYGWGDGEWMRTWEEECKELGIEVAETYICNETPAGDELAQCNNLGGTLVG